MIKYYKKALLLAVIVKSFENITKKEIKKIFGNERKVYKAALQQII